MKLKYENVKIKVVTLASADVITGSNGNYGEENLPDDRTIYDTK